MITIKNSSRAGFVGTDNVIVKDNKTGAIFYRHSKPGKTIFFNLPPGSWTIKGAKHKTTPLRYENKIILPAPERFLYPRHYKIVNVPDSVTTTGYINHDKKKIFINEDLEGAKRDFVLYHELGHRHYSTEWKCDIFAAREMLKKGYNPSQVLNASDGLQRQPGRIERIFDNFINNFS